MNNQKTVLLMVTGTDFFMPRLPDAGKDRKLICNSYYLI